MAQKKGADAPEPLRSVLSALAGSTKALNKLDDQFADVIRTVEETLRMHIGTRVSVLMDAHDDGDVTILAFTKINGKWCLSIEEGDHQDEEENFRKVPLLSSSRETRARVFADGFVDKLIRQAHGQVVDQIAARQRAMANASDLLESLGEFVVAPKLENDADDSGLPF